MIVFMVCNINRIITLLVPGHPFKPYICTYNGTSLRCCTPDISCMTNYDYGTITIGLGE